MSEVTFSVDEELYETLKMAASLRGVSIDALLREMLTEPLDELRARMNDPMIGMFKSGRGDLSEHDEEILQAGWKPD